MQLHARGSWRAVNCAFNYVRALRGARWIMPISQTSILCSLVASLSCACFAPAQVAPPPGSRAADASNIGEIARWLPPDGGFEAVFHHQSDDNGSSRRYIAYAFASGAFLSSDGVGGFQGLDTRGNGFHRHWMDNSPVQDLNMADVPSAFVGYGRMIPTLYLLHFVRHNAAVNDFTSLPDGGVSFRVQQDQSLKVLSDKDIAEGAKHSLDMTLTVDKMGRVTSVLMKNDTFESLDEYWYGETTNAPWYVPQTSRVGKADWVLLDAGNISEADSVDKFTKTSMTVKVATVTAEMKHAEIQRIGGFDAVAKQTVAQTMNSQDSKSAFPFMTAAIATAVLGGVGVFVLVRKHRLSA